MSAWSSDRTVPTRRAAFRPSAVFLCLVALFVTSGAMAWSGFGAARVNVILFVVSGWLGANSIKWVGRIEVSRRPLRVPWNTEDYVIIGPEHPANGAVLGTPINELPVTSLVELDWPARLKPTPQIIRGRAFGGEHRIATVEGARIAGRKLAIGDDQLGVEHGMSFRLWNGHDERRRYGGLAG